MGAVTASAAVASAAVAAAIVAAIAVAIPAGAGDDEKHQKRHRNQDAEGGEGGKAQPGTVIV